MSFIIFYDTTQYDVANHVLPSFGESCIIIIIIIIIIILIIIIIILRFVKCRTQSYRGAKGGVSLSQAA